MSVDLSFYGRAENGPKVKGIMAEEGYKLSDTEIARGHASYNTQLEAGEKSADEKALAEFSYTSVMKAVNSEEVRHGFFPSFAFSSLNLMYLLAQQRTG